MNRYFFNNSVYYFFILLFFIISCLENAKINLSFQDDCISFPSSYFVTSRNSSFDTLTNKSTVLTNASKILCSHTDIIENESFNLQCSSQTISLSNNTKYDSFERYLKELTNPGYTLYAQYSSLEINISNTFQEVAPFETTIEQISQSIEEYFQEQIRSEITYNDWDNIGRPLSGIVQIYDSTSNQLLCGGNPKENLSTRYRFFSYDDTEEYTEIYRIENGGTPSFNNQCPEVIKTYEIFEKQGNERNKIRRFHKIERFTSLQNISTIYQVNTTTETCY